MFLLFRFVPLSLRIAAAASTALLLALCATPRGTAAPPPTTRQLIAYVFPDGGTVDPAKVSAGELTRINYAFAKIAHGSLAEGLPSDAQNLAILRTLRAKYPSLKLLVSVGGWLGSGQFSDMALTAASRQMFIDSAVAFLRKYDLDGLDIDWEYPGLPGSGNRFRPEDKQNYTLLLRGLRERFEQEAPALHRHLLLSIAAGSDDSFIAHTEMAKVQRYVDTVNLMAYDYYEPSDDKITGNHAPLYLDPRDPKHISADLSVKAYEAAGVPAGKIVLGIPFYGHAWSGVPAANHGLFQPGRNAAQDYANDERISALPGQGFLRTWDAAAGVPSLYNPATRVFVSYDDPQSLALKGAYAVQQGLGGIMFWDSEGDPSGLLVRTLHRALHL